MPQERESQSPIVTAEEWQKIKAETPRDLVAARALMARNITGIPRRPYLTGDNDSAPILRGLREFCAAVYAVVDAVDQTDGYADLIDRNAEVVAMMEELPH